MLLTLGVLAGVQPALADLQPGDIVIVRLQREEDSSGSFTWLALRDFTEDEVVSFTDSSWGASMIEGERMGWRITEPTGGAFAPGGISAGAIGEVQVAAGLVDRDQMFLYEGLGPTGPGQVTSQDEVSFAWAMTWGGPWETTGGVNASVSYEPDQVRHLGASVALGSGAHWYYSGPLSGSTEALLAQIRNPDNWALSESGGDWQAVRGGTFDVNPVPVPEPSQLALLAGAAAAAAVYRRNRRRREIALIPRP